MNNKKTPEEIEKLKENWKQDPCWDIEDTEGFEAHREELRAWRENYEFDWDMKEQEKKNKRRVKVMEATGVNIADTGILDSLSTWEDISHQVNQCASYSEDGQVNMTAFLVRATLLQAAQLKRIADVLESMNDSDTVVRSAQGSG